MTDLTKLPPAPWKNGGRVNFGDGWVQCLDGPDGLLATSDHDGDDFTEAKAVIDFAALARNILDFWMRHPNMCVAACMGPDYTTMFRVEDDGDVLDVPAQANPFAAMQAVMEKFNERT